MKNEKPIRSAKLAAVLLALLLCLGGIAWAAVSAFLPEPEPNTEPPALSKIIAHSILTTIEKRNEDGSISMVEVNLDPVFRGKFSPEDLQRDERGIYEGEPWHYRVTYHWGEQHQAVFCFAPLWVSLNGEICITEYSSNICASLNGLWDDWASRLPVLPSRE